MIGHMPWISQESPSYIEKMPKKSEKRTHLNVRNGILKKFQSLQFLVVQGSLNPNITFLGEKLWPVAWNQKCTSVIWGKNRKISIKSVNMKISKKQKMRFLLISQGSLNPKIRFLGQKMCSVAWLRTDRQTHTDRHESDYWGHPLRVSGFFPSTYHQGSAQQVMLWLEYQ